MSQSTWPDCSWAKPSVWSVNVLDKTPGQRQWGQVAPRRVMYGLTTTWPNCSRASWANGASLPRAVAQLDGPNHTKPDRRLCLLRPA